MSKGRRLMEARKYMLSTGRHIKEDDPLIYRIIGQTPPARFNGERMPALKNLPAKKN